MVEKKGRNNGRLSGGNSKPPAPSAEVISLVTGERTKGGAKHDIRRIDRAAEEATGQGRLTSKQEAFAIRVAQGRSLSDAYREAYDVKPGTKPETVWNSAYRLSEKPEVAARIKAEVERIEREKPHDDAAIRRLVKDYLVSTVSDTTLKQSDRTRAAELLGKVGGVSLFSQPEEKKGSVPTSEAEMEALKAELLALLQGQPVGKVG